MNKLFTPTVNFTEDFKKHPIINISSIRYHTVIRLYNELKKIDKNELKKIPKSYVYLNIKNLDSENDKECFINACYLEELIHKKSIFTPKHDIYCQCELNQCYYQNTFYYMRMIISKELDFSNYDNKVDNNNVEFKQLCKLIQKTKEVDLFKSNLDLEMTTLSIIEEFIFQFFGDSRRVCRELYELQLFNFYLGNVNYYLSNITIFKYVSNVTLDNTNSNKNKELFSTTSCDKNIENTFKF